MHYTAIKYLVLWNYFQKKTTNESYYYCSQHFRLNFVGPIFI